MAVKDLDDVITAMEAYTTAFFTTNVGLADVPPVNVPCMALDFNPLDVPPEASFPSNVFAGTSTPGLRMVQLIDLYGLVGSGIETRRNLVAYFDQIIDLLDADLTPGAIQYPMSIFSTHIGNVIYLGQNYVGIKITLQVRYDTV